MDIVRMRQAAGNASGLLKVLANEDRLLLLCQMVDGEKCVSDLEEMLDIRQPTLSQQVKQLEDENGNLSKLVADLSLDKEMLQDVLRRKL